MISRTWAALLNPYRDVSSIIHGYFAHTSADTSLTPLMAVSDEMLKQDLPSKLGCWRGKGKGCPIFVLYPRLWKH